MSLPLCLQGDFDLPADYFQFKATAAEALPCHQPRAALNCMPAFTDRLPGNQNHRGCALWLRATPELVPNPHHWALHTLVVYVRPHVSMVTSLTHNVRPAEARANMDLSS